MGTVAYMSPEQARGTPLDARTDLFSLGSVIYEMATGQPPFGGGSTADVFAALLRETPPPVSKVNPAMPKRLDPIVARLLAKDPAQRYPSAEALQEDLDALETHAGKASPPGSGKKWLWPALAGLLVVLIAAGLAWWKYRPAPAATGEALPSTGGQESGAAVAPKSAKDSIILADFVNHTGDPVFDNTLNQALQIDLEQSPVINIVSQQHLAQSVKFLGKPEGTPLTTAIAREIGEREGMKAILTGTIASLGKEYVITLTAQNTATGDEIVSEQAQTPDKEHVLDALGRAAAAMRGKLGEDLASIKKLDTPFGQATTSSLEAFRAYALGDKAHEKARNIPEAEGHYLRAVELDPNFAMAYARLGVVYVNSGQFAKAEQVFCQSLRTFDACQRARAALHCGPLLPERDRQHTQSDRDPAGVDPDLPGTARSYININVAYQTLGQFEQALPFAQKAVEMQPEDAIASENLVGDYVGLYRMPEALAEMARARKLSMDGSTDFAGIKFDRLFFPGRAERNAKASGAGGGKAG